MKHGDLVRITVVIEAEIETELDEVTSDQLTELMFSDDAIKSSVFGGIGEVGDGRDHDTALFFKTIKIQVISIEGDN